MAESVGLVSCVHNEDRFLEGFLRYHHHLGVERAYLFMDRCSDKSAAIAAKFDWVDVMTVEESWWEGVEFLGDLQNRCSDLALVRAREEGMDWLIHLDPDEFAVPSFGPLLDALPPRGALLKLVEGVSPSAMQIRLATAEALMVDHGEAPFWLQQHFAFSAADAALESARGVRPQPQPHMNGHADGKSLVRTKGAVQAKNSHGWVVDQGARLPDRPRWEPLPTVLGGWHLHYHVVSPSHLVEKFRKQARFPLHLRNNAPLEPFKRAAVERCLATNDQTALIREAKARFLPVETARELAAKANNLRELLFIKSFFSGS